MCVCPFTSHISILDHDSDRSPDIYYFDCVHPKENLGDRDTLLFHIRARLVMVWARTSLSFYGDCGSVIDQVGD